MASSYVSLYRRYRSQNFEELVGQDHIRVTLQNALTSGRLAQAYLFCGPRGTGKTSTARILAKAMNCQRGPTADPCNECTACVSITSGACLDVIEIDAASHTGVDDVREVIVGKVHFPPAEVRRKVYIIDEVHKLSNSAFNALLKTLEEPPPHVHFVLATTDPQQVPATITSRCQRYDFHRISHSVIVQHLRHICEQEKLQMEEGALHAIAEVADGALRDALVVLEQVATPGAPVGEAMVVGILGMTPQGALSRMVDDLMGGNTAAALEGLHRLLSEGKDPLQLARDLVGYLRKLMLFKVCPDPSTILTVSPTLHERLTAQAAHLSVADCYKMVRAMVETLTEMKEDPVLIVILWEAALVRLSLGRTAAAPSTAVSAPRATAGSAPEPAPRTPASAEPRRTPGPEAHVPAPAERQAPPPPAPSSPASNPGQGPVAAAPQASTQTPANVDLREFWRNLLATVQRKSGGPVYTFLAEARPVSLQDGALTIMVGAGKTFERDVIEKNRSVVEEAAASIVTRPVKLTVKMVDDAEGKVHQGYVKNTIEIFPGSRIVE